MTRQQPRQLPGLLLLTGLVVCSFGLARLVPSLSPLAIAVLLGALIANVFGWPGWAGAGTDFAAKHLMRAGVALLGLQLSFAALQSLGWLGALGVFVFVVGTIVLIQRMTVLAGLSADLGLLIGVGYGVCGASAIAAVRPQTNASREETSYAIGLVTLCGSLSIIVLPIIGAALGFDDHTFGSWAGAAVHDVGQVVATASVRGDVALQAAVVVKLMRVLMLAPVVIGTSLLHRRRAAADAPRARLVPGFVLAFIGLLILNNTGLLPDAVAAPSALASKVLLAFGLAALGTGVQVQRLRTVGGRPLFVGLLAWALVALGGYLLILLIL